MRRASGVPFQHGGRARLLRHRRVHVPGRQALHPRVVGLRRAPGLRRRAEEAYGICSTSSSGSGSGNPRYLIYYIHIVFWAVLERRPVLLSGVRQPLFCKLHSCVDTFSLIHNDGITNHILFHSKKQRSSAWPSTVWTAWSTGRRVPADTRASTEASSTVPQSRSRLRLVRSSSNSLHFMQILNTKTA